MAAGVKQAPPIFSRIAQEERKPPPTVGEALEVLDLPGILTRRHLFGQPSGSFVPQAMERVGQFGPGEPYELPGIFGGGESGMSARAPMLAGVAADIATDPAASAAGVFGAGRRFLRSVDEVAAARRAPREAEKVFTDVPVEAIEKVIREGGRKVTGVSPEPRLGVPPGEEVISREGFEKVIAPEPSQQGGMTRRELLKTSGKVAAGVAGAAAVGKAASKVDDLITGLKPAKSAATGMGRLRTFFSTESMNHMNKAITRFMEEYGFDRTGVGPSHYVGKTPDELFELRESILRYDQSPSQSAFKRAFVVDQLASAKYHHAAVDRLIFGTAEEQAKAADDIANFYRLHFDPAGFDSPVSVPSDWTDLVTGMAEHPIPAVRSSSLSMVEDYLLTYTDAPGAMRRATGQDEALEALKKLMNDPDDLVRTDARRFFGHVEEQINYLRRDLEHISDVEESYIKAFDKHFSRRTREIEELQ